MSNWVGIETERFTTTRVLTDDDDDDDEDDGPNSIRNIPVDLLDAGVKALREALPGLPTLCNKVFDLYREISTNNNGRGNIPQRLLELTPGELIDKEGRPTTDVPLSSLLDPAHETTRIEDVTTPTA